MMSIPPVQGTGADGLKRALARRALEDAMADWLDPEPVTVEVTVGGTWGQFPGADAPSPPYAGTLFPGGTAGRHGGRSGVPDLAVSLAGGRSALAGRAEGHAGNPADVPLEGAGPLAGLGVRTRDEADSRSAAATAQGGVSEPSAHPPYNTSNCMVKGAEASGPWPVPFFLN
jgi:hypothetical protein